MRAAALLTAVVLGAAVPVPASAHSRDSGQLLCHGTESVAYHPGITLRPRHIRVTVDGRFGSCAGGGGKVRSGGYHEEFTLFTGCNNLLDGFRTSRTYRWNTGDASTAGIAGSSTAVAGQVVTPAAGTVTHGLFHGRKVLQLIPLPQPGALQCLAGGVTGAAGPTVLTVL
ncbi:hypothetical protein I5Q34_25850 [Streptomyces sp. AV19]|uniref:hypothetical protein n=1 Tax=Streptomyces sp. AV19 TaxID=2793068 RepID=UPI0018FEAAC3|nr:hypothetical protein [Streptomyces sp. AV19]MBH1937653.1 hypothetical protein [Streptomyces sp. AV19]MDG4536322.1 hypothetical protein [Streptomyces sp. AV19]